MNADVNAGRVALVTGGTRGIGNEIAHGLAAAGMIVFLTGRDATGAERAAAAISRATGGTVFGRELEVTDPHAATALVDAVAAERGRIDVLVNNAAIELEPQHSALDADLDNLRTMFEADVIAPWRLIQLIVPLMRAHGWGRIVNVTSGLAQFERMADGRRVDHSAGHGGYRVCKAALNGLTALIAGELIESGILVNAADPGFCQTAMGAPTAPFTAEEGADVSIYLATLADDGPTAGWFFQRQLKRW